MSIFINEEDAKLFQQNGFSYDDVNNTVEHYRQNGLKDEEIQTKILPVSINRSDFAILPIFVAK